MISDPDYIYNKEPVHYCRRCLFLDVTDDPLESDSERCANCGSANIGMLDFYSWDKLFKQRYGISYIEMKDKLKKYKQNGNRK